MRGEYAELSCPFCDKGKIACWYIAGAVSVKRSSARSLPGKTSAHKSSDIWLIKSGCDVCNKSQEEIEKELRQKNMI